MLPDVDNKDFAGGQSEKRTFSFEILVFATFATIGSLDIHDENIVGHLCAATLLALVLGHPDTFRGLATFRLGHDGEFGAKEVVQEGRFAGRLGAEDGNEVVVEARVGDICDLEVVVEVLAVQVSNGCGYSNRRGCECILEFLVLVNNLDAMLVASAGGLFADGREVAVHDCNGICEAPGARTTIRPGYAVSCKMAMDSGAERRRKGVKKL